MPQGVFPSGNSGMFKKGHKSWNGGKHHSKETKEKISKTRKEQGSPWTSKRNKKFSGKNSPSYKGENVKTAVCNSVIGKYLKKKYKVCVVCKENKKLEIHHIDKNSTNNKKNNLMVVCRSCHRKLDWKHERLKVIKEIYNEIISNDSIDDIYDVYTFLENKIESFKVKE